MTVHGVSSTTLEGPNHNQSGPNHNQHQGDTLRCQVGRQQSAPLRSLTLERTIGRTVMGWVTYQDDSLQLQDQIGSCKSEFTSDGQYK